MELVLTLLVRDEIDIIKGMIDFHLAQGVDHIIITDNGSVDGTFEICQEYTKTGKVELITEPPSDFSQHRWVSRMANLAYEKYKADWVIHADADEMFIPSPQYRDLKSVLQTVPPHISVLEIPRHDFVPFDRSMRKSPHSEMIYRKSISLNLRGQPLSPKVVHRGAEEVVITQGNHSVTGKGLTKVHPFDQLSVYHYPIRSCPQFHSKVLNGGSGYEKNTELPAGLGFHKRYWYDLLLKNKLRDAYYNDHFMSSEGIQKALLNHDVVVDYRVADFFQSGYKAKFRRFKELFFRAPGTAGNDPEGSIAPEYHKGYSKV